MDKKYLRIFEERLAQKMPGFQVLFKDESRWLRFLGFLVEPFSPQFMTDFTSTFGKTVYFPSRLTYGAKPVADLSVLAHEYVHVWDGLDPRFKISYISPQVLSVLPFTAFLAFGWPLLWAFGAFLGWYIVCLGLYRLSKPLFWVALSVGVAALIATHLLSASYIPLACLFGALVCLAPWPSPWRVKWEMRGYTMSLAVVHWLNGSISTEFRREIVNYFVGPAYLWMSWSRAPIEVQINRAHSSVKDLTILDDTPYRHVYELLEEYRLLKVPPASAIPRAKVTISA